MRTEYLEIDETEGFSVSGKGYQWDADVKNCKATVLLRDIKTAKDTIFGILKVTDFVDDPHMRIRVEVNGKGWFDTGFTAPPYQPKGTTLGKFPRLLNGEQEIETTIEDLINTKEIKITLIIWVAQSNANATASATKTYSKEEQKFYEYKIKKGVPNIEDDSGEIESSETLSLTNITNNIKELKPGYDFIKWEKAPTDNPTNQKEYLTTQNAWESITLDKDTTFTAQWTAIQSELTLNPKDGLFNDNNRENQRLTVIYDSPYNNNISEYNPIKSGYEFLGWYDGDKQIYDADGNYITEDNPYWTEAGKCKATESFTLKAKWKIKNIAYVLDRNNNNKKWNLALTYVFIDNNDIKEWKPAIIYILDNNIWQQSKADAGIE